MTARILDGKAVANQLFAELKSQVAGLGASPPCLAVVLCSDDPASHLYVQKKREACEQVGIVSRLHQPYKHGLGKNPEYELEYLLNYLSEDHTVHGILVQLPLPHWLNTATVCDWIDPQKDVDVLNPVNVGLLLQGRPRFVPCTPAGIQELLLRHHVEIQGQKVAIINRSDIVGKPLHALLCQNNIGANATVTLCHDQTPPQVLREICLASNIIVVAVGQPSFLTADMVSAGTVVVDVGINRVPDSKKILGDVDFAAVSQKAAWISPVPGGVGPMTIAMLLKNTLAAYQVIGQSPKSNV